MYFSTEQTARLQELADRLERRTGVEILTAVVGKCDTYPEIPWKAFALGSAGGALAFWALTFLQPERIPAAGALLPVMIVLGAGALFVLLSVFWPAFARLFLDGTRAETETLQYARSVFWEREIFRTRDRTGILLLVSLFERRVVLLPDKGVENRLDPRNLPDVIAHMGTFLRRGDHAQAVQEGLSLLEEGLVKAGFTPSADARDRIPEEFIQEKGEDR
jgi:putative membrane protein